MNYGPFHFGEIVRFDVKDEGFDPRDDVFIDTIEGKICGKAKSKSGADVFLKDFDGNRHYAKLEDLKRVEPRVWDRVSNGEKTGTVKEVVAHMIAVQFDGEGHMPCVRPDQVYVISRGEPPKAIDLVDDQKTYTGDNMEARREAYAEAEDDVLRNRASPSVLVTPPEGSFSGVDPVTKDTNPKDALAGFKPRWWSFIPLRVLIGVGKAMFEGAWKYGKHNYRESGVRASVYLDAAVCGHLMPFMEGQDYDENGMHHIDKAIASLMVLRDAQLGSNWIDDRPLAASGFAEQIERETAHFQSMKAELKAKFGDPVAPFTEATRGQPRDKK